MPGKHDPEKKFVSFSLKREMLYRLDQAAEEAGVDRTKYVLDLFEKTLKGVELTPANKERVDAEVKAERKRRAALWSGYEERVAKLRGHAKAEANAKE